MKKLLLAVLCLCLALGVAGCTKKAEGNNGEPTEKGIVIEDNLHSDSQYLDPDDDSSTLISWTDVLLPKTDGSTEAYLSINSYYDNIREATINAYNDVFAPAAKEAHSFAIDNGREFIEHYTFCDYWIVWNDGEYLSVVRGEKTYNGGAREGFKQAADVFNAKGVRLTMDDMFAVPKEEYMPLVFEAAREILSKREDLFPDYNDLLEQQFKDTDFYISNQVGKTFCIYFGENTIAPATAGLIEVNIPFEKLKSLKVK